ncbi:hypothetical protein [Anaerophaga thermohalophila]|jgi:hypothetical protein|uniref:hypothetical protein n=1 Tax=Anaerophaga thermohalophila TaxID=177400 RepID=UPI00031F67BB|nr:hypothetical protein [Anaerophaga thermohalophila]
MKEITKKTLEKHLGRRILYFGPKKHSEWDAFHKMDSDERSGLLPTFSHSIYFVYSSFTPSKEKYFRKFLSYNYPLVKSTLKSQVNKVLIKDEEQRETGIRKIWGIEKIEEPCFVFLDDIGRLKIEFWEKGESLFDVLHIIKNQFISGEREPPVYHQLAKKPKTEKEEKEESYSQQLYEISWFVRKKLQKFGKEDVVRTFIEILKEEALGEQEMALSPLLIDEKFNVHLPNYETSIKLTPLEKTAYFLFLNHPEGIMFCDLPDYRNEVAEIYKHVNNRLSLRSNQKSIDKLVDPLSNSMSEKLSKIRNSFLFHHNESIVEPYVVSGKRGGPKKVSIKRELITIENDGKFWRI